MDLLRPRTKKERGAQRKKTARGGKKRVTRGEDSSRGKLPRRGKYGHDKESKILGISKLSSHCAYAKMPNLVHQMPSLPKRISQMQNCWRAIFRARSFDGEPWPEIIPGWIVSHIYISYEQLEQFLGQSWPKRTGP